MDGMSDDEPGTYEALLAANTEAQLASAKAFRDGTEATRQLSASLAERRDPILPPLDADDPQSGYKRLYAIGLAVQGFALGMRADFLSLQYEDGATFTAESGVIRIVHADHGAITMEDLASRFD